MRYRIREKVWTIRDRYVIRDPDDVELFHVEGELMSFGKKLTLSTADGRELARIEQKVFAWRPTYFLRRSGRPEARIRRMYRPIFKPRFEIEAPGEPSIVASGNLWAHEFEFQRGSKRIGLVSKKVFSWADSYGVEIDDEEDQVLLLAAAVVIDLVIHEQRSGS